MNFSDSLTMKKDFPGEIKENKPKIVHTKTKTLYQQEDVGKKSYYDDNYLASVIDCVARNLPSLETKLNKVMLEIYEIKSKQQAIINKDVTTEVSVVNAEINENKANPIVLTAIGCSVMSVFILIILYFMCKVFGMTQLKTQITLVVSTCVFFSVTSFIVGIMGAFRR